MHLTIHCDGGSRGNPGFGYGSYEITDDLGMLRAKGKRVPLGDRLTSNQAEYLILICALKRASDCEADSIWIFTDSLLVVNQLIGTWRCKNSKLAPLRDEARALMELLHATVNWNSREVSVEKFGH